MNGIIFRSLFSVSIPASKEPIGLTRLDGKRPDGLTLVPWQGGKPVTWDITVVSTSMRQVIMLLELQDLPFLGKRPSILVSLRVFCTNRAQNSGAIAHCSLDFLTEVGRRLSAATGDAHETAFLFQRISVALQRFMHESFVVPDVEPDL